MTEPMPLAVFDLDGTLVRGDTLLPFLSSYARRQWRLGPFVRLPFELAAYGVGLMSARTAKERVLRAFVAGQSLADLQAHADWFAEHWAHRRWQPEIVARLGEHQARKHRVILLSASPDLYVPVLARRLGIHEVICTRVASEDGICSGRIVGPNCKGPAKVAALTAYLGGAPLPPGSTAYGDSKSDLPLLRLVKFGFLCKRGQLRAIIGQTGPGSLR